MSGLDGTLLAGYEEEFTIRGNCIGDENGLIRIRETDHWGNVLPEFQARAEMFLAAYSFGVVYEDSSGQQLLTCDYLLTPLAKLQAARMVIHHMQVLFIDRSKINPSVNTLNDVGCTWIRKGDDESMLRLQTSFDMTESELESAFTQAKAWRPSEESLLLLWDGLTLHQRAVYVLELRRFEKQLGEVLFTDELVERIGPQWMRFAE